MSTKRVIKDTPSLVRDFVQDRSQFVAMMQADEQNPDDGKVQINVRVGMSAAFQLERLAKHLHFTRAQLAVELVEAAIHDALTVADLPGLNDPEVLEEYQAYMEARDK